MSISHLLLQRLIPLLLLVVCLVSPVSAQGDLRTLDPADIFFQAWLTIREGEKLEKAGEFNDARLKYQQASKYYNVISRYHKNWKPDMVKRRVASTNEAITLIEKRAIEELAKKNQKTEDLVEGGKSEPNARPHSGARGHQKQPTRSTTPKSSIAQKTPRKSNPPSLQANYTQAINRAQQRQLQMLQRDNKRLRNDLARAKAKGKQNESTEQQRLIKKIAAKDREIATIRDLLARAPLQADLDQLAKKNRTYKFEIDIVALSLKSTKVKLAKEQVKAKKFEEQAALATRRAKEIEKTMKAQKRVDNRIVRKLREELKSITKVLDNTRRELGKANAKMAVMQKSLNQANSTISDLTKERDALRNERDRLADILKQNDAAGVRKLITENMRLGKELKETSDRLNYLTKKNDATKDELLEAKRDLAVAKTRIMRYQRERVRHGKRIRALESQLRDAEAELATAKSKPDQSVSQEEVEILKATVKRLIAAQERRHNAEKILWDTYTNSKKIIPGIVEAFEDVREAKVELTKEEQGLMVLRRPDREFTSPDRVSPEHAQTYGSALEKDIADHTNLVKRFFEKGRYEAARQILADMDERFPGHFPTLINRGVVELKTDHYIEATDIFSEAITMRENSSYAHYMLGLAHYQSSDLDAARNEFEISLDIKPGNDRAHFYLGTLAGVGHRYEQAEKHLKEAIKLNPTRPEPYFNLSMLYLHQKRKKEAQDAYAKALENGASPNPAHEKKLGL